MAPIPNLSGSGGSASNGPFGSTAGIGTGFGSFQVGGRGNSGAGGTGSASPGDATASAGFKLPAWAIPAAIGLAALSLVLLLIQGRRR